MDFVQVDDTWLVEAPWLEEPVMGATPEEAYWQAIAELARHRGRRG
jgi:hypothetical protein